MPDHDTPTQRATINQLNLDDLSEMLEGIRARRLERVQRLEAVAKVKADAAQLTSWLAYERAYGIALRHLNKFAELEKKADELIHKARLKAAVVQFEVREMADE